MKYLLLILAISCAEPKPNNTGRKPSIEVGETPKKDKCAINMAKLAILVQEYAKIGGKTTIDDDVNCPTDQQLQDMRDGIAEGHRYVAEQENKRVQEQARQDEERVREWVGVRLPPQPFVAVFDDQCYLCTERTLSECQGKIEQLKKVDC